MQLTMVGTGYVGLVTGACFANTGNNVMCLDVDSSKIDMLNAGECPIYEPGLQELIHSNVRMERLSFTTDKRQAYLAAQIIFICVGTPTGADGKPDLSYVLQAADDIASAILEIGPDQRPKAVVVKSTVPVGTTFRVRDRIAKRVGDLPFYVADNPEFLKEGAAINDFNKPDRVVVGVENDEVGAVMLELYDPFVRQGHPIYVMDIASAEMVKYASNNFLATKISFINEMARLCEANGADIVRVREGMCADSRIGPHFLYPGLGYGGSCFPKDTLACIAMGESSSVDTLLSSAVHEVNQQQRRFFFDKIQDHFNTKGGLEGKTLAFWGIAFKPNTDDIREAPAISLMRLASKQGASIRAHDPVAADNGKRELGEALHIFDDMYDTLEGADALVICTDWDEFKSPDFGRVKRALRSPVIFDGRNLYKRAQMRNLEITYYSVGRQPVSTDA